MATRFDFNPFDEATRRDPYPLYARARREHPVFRHRAFPVVSVFRFADCQAILKDAATWSNVFPPPPNLPRDEDFTPSLIGTDPPAHTRLRGLVNQAFTPRIIRQLEPRLVEVANGLLGEAVRAGTVDLVEALAYPLPVIAIAEIIGIPPEDRAQFKVWSDAAVENLGTGLLVPPTTEQIERQREIIRQMREYFLPLVEERRVEPREDLLSGLVAAEAEGSKLEFDEMIQMLILLLVAGNETTTTLIGNAVLALLDHPDQLERLRADRELLPTAVEEVMRFASPVQLDPRRATRDTEIDGVEIEAEQVLITWLGSANRDEEVFVAPEVFDVGRKDNRHLGFGFGQHFCLGANLARLEARVAVGALLDHTRGFRRTDDEPLPLHPSIVFRGVTALPLELEAAG
jgi:cytochrome P450